MATMTSDEIRVGPLAIRFLVEAEESGGSVSMFEFDVPSQAKVPIAHSHDAYEETLYGLSGVLTWTVDGETHEVGPGDVLCIPRGVVHKFENEGEVAGSHRVIVPARWDNAARLRSRKRRARGFAISPLIPIRPPPRDPRLVRGS